VVVEHNLDIWAEADWMVDLGPEGGAGGGRLVSSAPPEQLIQQLDSHTGRALAEFLSDRTRS